MRINVAIPEPHVEAPVLDAALEAVTRLNEKMLAEGEVPTFDKALPHGIRWKPEPPGEEHFDHAKTVLRRKHGDCDDLAPWHAASLRHTGEDPEATAIVKRSGPRRWHAVVQRSDGSIDDPSKAAGMGQPRGGGVIGAALPVMPGMSSVVGGAYIVRPQIALRPVYGAWQARADLPWQWREHLEQDKPSKQDYAMTALHTAPVASTALVGALHGAVLLGECAGFADEDHLERLDAIADAVDGASWDELAEVYGEEHADAAIHIVGGFFGGLKKLVKKVSKPLASLARPLVSKGLQFVPGVGPIASTAFDMAADAASRGGGGGGRARAPGAPPGAAAHQFFPGGGPGGFNLKMRCTPFG